MVTFLLKKNKLSAFSLYMKFGQQTTITGFCMTDVIYKHSNHEAPRQNEKGKRKFKCSNFPPENMPVVFSSLTDKNGQI